MFDKNFYKRLKKYEINDFYCRKMQEEYLIYKDKPYFSVHERRRITLNKGKLVIMIVAVLVCVTIGFVVGQVVQAMGTLPGSSDDPVATESYVETTIGERMAALSTKVDELEAEVAALKGETPSTSSSTGNTSSASDNTGSQTSGESLTITGNGVNLRSAASKNGDVVTTLSKGTKVTKIGEEGDWYQVQTSNGQTGYVSSTYAQ